MSSLQNRSMGSREITAREIYGSWKAKACSLKTVRCGPTYSGFLRPPPLIASILLPAMPSGRRGASHHSWFRGRTSPIGRGGPGNLCAFLACSRENGLRRKGSPMFPSPRVFFFAARRWLAKEYAWTAPVDKAQLTEDDKKRRVKYARIMLRRPMAYWKRVVYIDGHSFKKTSSLRSQSHVGRYPANSKYRY